MTAATSKWSILPNWEFRPFPTGTYVIVVSVFLALIKTVGLMVTERLDLALTGGVVPITSIVLVNLVYFPAVMFYGFTGGLIVAWTSTVVSLLTASHPMAPWFIVTDGAHVIPMVLLVWLMKPRSRGFRLWEILAIGMVGAICDVLAYAIGSRIILDLPWEAIGVAILISLPLHLLGCFFGYALLQRLLKTDMIATGSREAGAQEV